MSRWLLRLLRSQRVRLLCFVTFGLLLELFLRHAVHYFTRISSSSDTVFQVGCRVPEVDRPRQNATIVMLARNSEIQQAVSAITSLELNFNQWFHYPIIFINNEEFSPQFMDALDNVASGSTQYVVLPPHAWGFPEWMDVDEARSRIKLQGQHEIPHAGREGYHHMCRFFSGYVSRAICDERADGLGNFMI